MMNEQHFCKDPKKRHKDILVVQESINDELKQASLVHREYVDSLSSFPQWLSLFSGVAGLLGYGVFGIVVVAFVFFIISSLLLLWIKRINALLVVEYSRRLQLVSDHLSDFSHIIVLFSRSEITEDEFIEKEKSFYASYKELRSKLYVEEVPYERVILGIVFWFCVAGSICLLLSFMPIAIIDFLYTWFLVGASYL